MCDCWIRQVASDGRFRHAPRCVSAADHLPRYGGGAGTPGSEPYGAAKAGINSLTLSLARAYAPKVRVNCIQAGPFLTDISKAWDMESFERNAKTGIALQRGGQPEEVVGAALYLVSEAGSFTTGAILRVDGGSFS